MIELKNISKTYQMGEIGVHALRNVSLKIEEGEFVAIMGASGSGKSTLLHVLGFLDRPDKGSYKLYDTEITKHNDNDLAFLRNSIAGFVFQQFHLLSRMTAVNNVALPLVYAGKEDPDAVKEKIRAVGLEKRASHRPSELSGGEQQRVAIARALVRDPLILFADEPTGNLDTKSEEEIISILKKLNKEGKTIIMVTHEQEIAVHAKRIIRMRDGEIIEDEKKDLSKNGVSSISLFNARKQDMSAKAKWINHIKQAVAATLGHKMRSALSVLGILIGVTAVIAMLALGQGARESIVERLSSMGSNLLVIRSGSSRAHGVTSEKSTRFTMHDLEAIRKISLIRRASASVFGRGRVAYKNKNWSTSIEGASVDYAPMRAAEPTMGRFFTQQEINTRRRVAVIGLTIVRELFGEEYPIGKSIKINRNQFQVIGIMPEKGGNAWRDRDDAIVIPVTTAMYRLFGKDYLDHIYAEVVSADVMDKAEEDIKKVIIKKHNLKEDSESFRIRNMAEIQDAIEGTVKTMTLLLGVIAGISLLVGGIGIMNIMLVSVTERTKEIGLRKAVGARKKDILIQFLIEAVFLTFIGGICGVALGSGISLLLAVVVGWTVKVSAVSIILATTFSIAIGIGFGMWPARHAAQLNPIECLRYE